MSRINDEDAAFSSVCDFYTSCVLKMVADTMLETRRSAKSACNNMHVLLELECQAVTNLSFEVIMSARQCIIIDLILISTTRFIPVL